jgi:hypothetical protein
MGGSVYRFQTVAHCNEKSYTCFAIGRLAHATANAFSSPLRLKTLDYSEAWAANQTSWLGGRVADEFGETACPD